MAVVRMLRLDGLDVAMIGASCCVSDEIPIQPNPKALLSAVKAGHLSVLEHAVASFAIEGISRVAETQLVRHRLASYSIQSGRYCTRDPLDYAVPDTCAKAWSSLDDAVAVYNGALRHLDRAMTEAGIPAEDRRMFYPQGTETNIVMTVNLRELSHICQLRRCSRAQDEIRELFDTVARKVCTVLKHKGLGELALLFEPQCVALGYCPEAKGCGRSPSWSDIMDRIQPPSAGDE